MSIEKLLKQKTTWAGLAAIVTGALPLFGVPIKIVMGVGAVVAGLATIFNRQAIQKVQDK